MSDGIASCFESRSANFGGESPAPKGLAMEKFPRPPVERQWRVMGHPIRQCGRNGARLRIKSRPNGVKP